MHQVHARWTSLTDNYDSFQLTVIGTFLIGNAVYWAHGLLYLILDLTHKPEFLYQFKIQKKVKLGLIRARYPLVYSMQSFGVNGHLLCDTDQIAIFKTKSLQFPLK